MGYIMEQHRGFQERFGSSLPRLRPPETISSGYKQARPIPEPEGLGKWIEKEEKWHKEFEGYGYTPEGYVKIETPSHETRWKEYEMHQKTKPKGSEEYFTRVEKIEEQRRREREDIPIDPTKYVSRPLSDWLLEKGMRGRHLIDVGLESYGLGGKPATGGLKRLAEVEAGASKFGVSLVTDFPAAILTGTEHILRAPKHAFVTAAPIGAGLTIGGMETRAREQPYEFTGELIGMAFAPRVAARGRAMLPAPYKLTPLEGVTPIPRITKLSFDKRFPFLKRVEHSTSKGTMERLLKPEVFEKPGRYPHGTSLDFIQQITGAGRKGLKIGEGKPKSIETALFFGAKDKPYLAFAGGEGGPAFLMWKTTPIAPRPRIVTKAFRRQQLERKLLLSKPEKLELSSLKRSLKAETTREALSIKGRLYPGAKPMSGYKWKGWEELEYTLAPGSKLYPTQTLRSKFWRRLGITKGTHYLYDPYGARTIEVLGVSAKPAPFKPVKPIIDLSKPYKFVQRLTGLSKKQLSKLKEIDKKIEIARKKGDFRTVRKLQREGQRISRSPYQRYKGLGRDMIRGRDVGRIVRSEKSPVTRDGRRRQDDTIRRILSIPERERPPAIRVDRRVKPPGRERPPIRTERRPEERPPKRERVPERPSIIPTFKVTEKGYAIPLPKKKPTKRKKKDKRKARQFMVYNPLKTPLQVLNYKFTIGGKKK